MTDKKDNTRTLKLNLGAKKSQVDPVKLEIKNTKSEEVVIAKSPEIVKAPNTQQHNNSQQHRAPFKKTNYGKNNDNFNQSEYQARLDAINRNKSAKNESFYVSGPSLSKLFADNQAEIDRKAAAEAARILLETTARENKEREAREIEIAQKEKIRKNIENIQKEKIRNDLEFAQKEIAKKNAIDAQRKTLPPKAVPVDAKKEVKERIVKDEIKSNKEEGVIANQNYKIIDSKVGEGKEYVSNIDSNALLERRKKVEELEREEKERARIAHLREKKRDNGVRAGLLNISTDDNGFSENRQWLRKKPKLQRNNTKFARPFIGNEIVIDGPTSIKDLASLMNIKAPEVINLVYKIDKKRHDEEFMLDIDTAELVIAEFGHTPIIKATNSIDSLITKAMKDAKNLQKRPPVVTIMGHVDHGKTSLLDALRSSNVVAQESGGITQHIGAYQIITQSGEKISFIDTPGHEAFTAMRMRGAQATDIVILVVAADDGVMPQTIESINHVKAAGVPMIVAVNKIDRTNGDIKGILNQLLQYDVVVEELGGEIMAIPISAKNKTNLGKLEEAILLLSDMMDLKAEYNTKASGVIIESKINNVKGCCATLLIQNGTLKKTDVLITNDKLCKVRAMLDEHGKNTNQAEPSLAVEVFGFDKTPEVGQKFIVVSSEKEAKSLLEDFKLSDEKRKMIEAKGESENVNILQILGDINTGNVKELKFIIKADVSGTIDAVRYSLEKLNSESLSVKVIHAATGAVTESDISLAKTTGAIIATFNIPIPSAINRLMAQEKVIVRFYNIIYRLIEDVADMIANELRPQKIEKPFGKLFVKKIFDIGGTGKIAGCEVKEGLVATNNLVRIKRNDKIIAENIEISVLKRLKENVREVKAGLECGIALENFTDIQERDILETYMIVDNK